jgi:hypothetical protein
MNGMQEQKIKVDGDFTLLMWFMGVSRYLRPGATKKQVSHAR